MTIDEAIKICNTMIFAASLSNPQGTPLSMTKEELTEAMGMAIKALKEVQQYRQIGTVEECRNAVEKIKQKRVTEKYKSGSPEDIEAYGEDAIFATCPTCGQLQNILWNSSNCGECGQALDWRANDGKTD